MKNDQNRSDRSDQSIPIKVNNMKYISKKKIRKHTAQMYLKVIRILVRQKSVLNRKKKKTYTYLLQ